MDPAIVIVIAAVAIAAWAFYTGRLHGIASALKGVQAQAAAHDSVADELKAAGNALAQFFAPPKARPGVIDSMAAAGAAVAAAAPQKAPEEKPAMPAKEDLAKAIATLQAAVAAQA